MLLYSREIKKEHFDGIPHAVDRLVTSGLCCLRGGELLHSGR